MTIDGVGLDLGGQLLLNSQFLTSWHINGTGSGERYDNSRTSESFRKSDVTLSGPLLARQITMYRLPSRGFDEDEKTLGGLCL